MNIVLAGKLNWSEIDISMFSRNGKNIVIFCTNEQEGIPISPDEVDIVICNWFFKYHDLRLFKRLKFVQLLSAGYNGIDPKVAREMGIVLKNAKNVYSIPISEFVIGNILAFYKKLPFFLKNQAQHKWEKYRNLDELYDKKVLILGTGDIGTEIAKRIGVFTRYVYGCNRTVRDSVYFMEIYPLPQIESIISDFDILIVSIALVDETRHMVDSRLLKRMKSDALLVNVSRGALIDENALIDCLQHGELGGAILDVFEEEPLSETNALWRMDNVIITPHNSFVSYRNQERLRCVILDNLTNWENEHGKETY